MNTLAPFFYSCQLVGLSKGGKKINLEVGYDVMKTLVCKDNQYGNDFWKFWRGDGRERNVTDEES